MKNVYNLTRFNHPKSTSDLHLALGFRVEGLGLRV